jgi:uncharacterized protein YoxC
MLTGIFFYFSCKIYGISLSFDLVDEMGTRIDDLESSIGQLVQQADAEAKNIESQSTATSQSTGASSQSQSQPSQQQQ